MAIELKAGMSVVHTKTGARGIVQETRWAGKGDFVVYKEADVKFFDGVKSIPVPELMLTSLLNISEQTELASLRAENAQLREACEASSAWVNKIYPDDVFTGESGDPGAIEIVALREMLANVLGDNTE